MIKTQALKYLGYKEQDLSDSFLELYDECEKEVIAYSEFKVVSQIYNYHNCKIAHVSLDYLALKELFNSCSQVMVIACTLGIGLEKRIHYYSHIDLTKMTIMDAIASSYLEYQCDLYEDRLIKQKHTFRFCPGYQDIPLSLNKELYDLLDCYKHIGLTITDHNLFLPQKSMIGIIGIGEKKTKKSCTNCIKFQDCILRKENQTCYRN